MARRRRRNWLLSRDGKLMAKIADALKDEWHGALIDGDMVLSPASALYLRKDGSMTARLVYRSIDRNRSATVVVRGLRASVPA